MKPWWKAIAGYPGTWLVVVVVVVAEWLYFALLAPGMVFALLAIVIGLVALVAWPAILGADGTLFKLRRPSIPAPTESTGQADLKRLRDELAALDDPRPLRQFDAARDKRDNLVRVLERRLDAGELTFSRYLTATEAVYSSTTDNLHEAEVALRSISTIDKPYIEERLAELKASSSDEDADAAERERETLEDRLDLHRQQQRRVADLLAQNEAALTAIDRTATSLAEAPIGRTPQDAEVAMAGLEELASRAGSYAPDS